MFETKRLLVRHFQEDDLDVFAELCADPVVMRYVEDGETLPRDTVAHWIDVCRTKYASRGYGTSAVFEKATGTFIGYCGVVRAPGNDFDELIYVFHRRVWGQGYATEVGAAMLQYVFERAPLERIYATVHPDNLASVRVLTKLGFAFYRLEDDSGTPVAFYSVSREALGDAPRKETP